MPTAVLVLAIISLTLAVISLAWQVATHFLSGPRVRVTVRIGLAHPTGDVLSWPVSGGQPSELTPLLDDRYTEPVIDVIVSNVGRMATTVHQVRFVSSAGGMYLPTSNMRGEPLPARVPEHDEKHWVVPAEPVIRLARAMEQAVRKDSVVSVNVDVTGGSAEAKEHIKASIFDDMLSQLSGRHEEGNRYGRA